MLKWFRAKTASQPITISSDTNKAVKTQPNLKQLSESMTLPAPTRDNILLITAIGESMELVKEYILDKHLEGLQEAVTCSITAGGNGLQDLIPYIENNIGMDSPQARAIAHDLTRKVMSNLSKQRMIKLGLKKFEWLHTSGGNNPFHEHVAMSGKIYRFDAPPIIDSKTGKRGFPSDLRGCRCKLLPIIEFDEE